MSSSSARVKKWRKNAKQRMVDAMGGCCQICGYDKCIVALEFHHIDKSTKTFGFGNSRANPINWDSICDELEKCVLLCANCHREVESGESRLPDTYKKFNTSYRSYKIVMQTEQKIKRTVQVNKTKIACTICKTKFIPYNSNSKTCSLACRYIASRKVSRPNYIQLLEDLKTMSYCEVGRKYGVSDNAIRKWIKTYKQ